MPNPTRTLSALAVTLALLLATAAAPAPAPIAAQLYAAPTAPSIILLIGDGMGTAQRQAATWASQGLTGTLHMDTLPVHGATHTGSADSAITDSAAAATAIATGVKTDNGVVGRTPDGHDLTSILDLARLQGMAVGLVSNTQLAHATPAGFIANVASRSQVTEIARQMAASGAEVLLAGGENHFLPIGTTGCHPDSGERTDGRDLVAEMAGEGYTTICEPAQLATLPLTTTHVLGLFADEGMPRPHAPALADLTQTALTLLSQDPDGFFLMVEGGQIDWAGHGNDAANVIGDTLAFDDAVAVALAHAHAAPASPLVIVTADHETGGMSLALAPTGAPGEDGPFATPDGTPFWVNWSSTYHTAVDVPLTATGPLSDRLAGPHENTHTFVVMRNLLYPFRTALPLVAND